jgi:chorismate mutase
MKTKNLLKRKKKVRAGALTLRMRTWEEKMMMTAHGKSEEQLLNSLTPSLILDLIFSVTSTNSMESFFPADLRRETLMSSAIF